MPSSALPIVPSAVVMALEHRPRRVLDVGPGNGKYGVLLREYARPALERLDAIELEERYPDAFPWLEHVYDELRIGDVCGVPTDELWDYDLVLMVDVLEHLDHDAGAELLGRIPGRVVVCTPRDFFQNPEADLGWESERHRSVWTLEELEAIRRLEVVDRYALDNLGGILVTMAPLGLTPPQ